MSNQSFFALQDILALRASALWQHFQAPLLGALLALAGVLLGRWRRWPILSTAAPALGVGLAWFLLSRTMAPAPSLSPWRLLPIALAGAVLCPLAARFLPRRGAVVCLVLLAAGGGWWLAGAPRQLADATRIGLLLGVLVLAFFLGGRLLTREGAGREGLGREGLGRLILAAFSLVGALWVIKAPPIWLLLALAPGLAALTMLAAPAAAALLLLAVAIDLLAVAVAAVLAVGRLPRLGVNAVDIAALAPLLAVLLAPRLRLPMLLAAPLAGGGAILLAWGAGMWFTR